MEYTVIMAVEDFIPVVLFFIASMILMRDLYDIMVKGAYALFCSGSIMVFIGGFYKALWKMLMALNICNWEALDLSYFPISGMGFMLIL